MEKIIDKLSSYHIFNYIFPGGLFLILCNNYLNIKVEQDKFIYFFFMAYFIGNIISRVSSLVTEKIIYFVFKIKKRKSWELYKSNKKRWKNWNINARY